MSFDLLSVEQLKLKSSLIISHLATNASKVQDNSAFFAIKGIEFDGHDFIDQAISNGASVIISQQHITRDDAFCIQVDNVRATLAEVSAKFYQPKPQNIVAITGTNGKTSVAHFYRQIIRLLGHDAASIGTTGVMINDKIINKTSLTSPDNISLNELLANMKQQKVDYVALEASSHGLDQFRLDKIGISVAAFTSFSQDHLDYHETMSKYFACKTLLFDRVLAEKKIVLLNADIEQFADLKIICQKKQHQIIDYGKSAQILKLKKQTNSLAKQMIEFSYHGQQYQFTTDIIGEFQGYNMMCAIGLSMATGQKIDDVVNVLEKLTSVPGRLERVNKNIFVDYAHTPDALEKVLKLLRPFACNKLIVLFGCGGDRDQQKRPLMGKIASNLADLVIITDDNPRYENAKNIRASIIDGIDAKKTIEIADREKAIAYAISNLLSDDILLIAGKGHENYQIIAGKTYDFDDVIIAKKYL